MRTLGLLALTVLLSLSASSVDAQHNARYSPEGRTTTTGVSGTSDSFRIGRLAPGSFVYALSLWDGPQGPCSAGAKGWSASRGFPDGLSVSWRREQRFETMTETLRGTNASTTVVDCSGGRDEQSAEAEFPRASGGGGVTVGIRPKGHNGAAAISGVRVCTTGNPGGGVRGIRIDTSTINAGGNGRVQRAGSETIEFSGCTDWQRAQRCPRNQVATGVELHYARPPKGADVLTGVALRCQSVSIQPL